MQFSKPESLTVSALKKECFYRLPIDPSLVLVQIFDVEEAENVVE